MDLGQSRGNWSTGNADHRVNRRCDRLLYIRTRAVDRTARAALEQAKIAAAQAKTAAERHEEQTKADRERRITESFAKAVEHLGSDRLETRLGAIYMLERIARESAREYWPIVETLTAYVRERAPWPPRLALANPFVQLQIGSGGDEMKGENSPAEEPKKGARSPRAQIRPATDIQAVLKAPSSGKRTWKVPTLRKRTWKAPTSRGRTWKAPTSGTHT